MCCNASADGHVERKHRHILNVSRALLCQSKPPVKFWGEAVMTASHLINRMPTKVLKGRFPYEILYGIKLQYDHLRVFGSLCYTHRRSHDRDKFGPRSRRCIFLGYPFGQKGWKVYDLDKKEFLISRDVVFYENEFPMVSVQVSPPAHVPSSTPVSDEDWLLQAEMNLAERGSSAIPPVIEQETEVSAPAHNSTATAHVEELPVSSPIVFDTLNTSSESSTPEDQLGRGQRVRVPPAKFQDYIDYNTVTIKDTPLAPLSAQSLSSDLVPGKTPYPLVEYLYDISFSSAHQVFLAAITPCIIPKSYSEAVKEKVW